MKNIHDKHFKQLMQERRFFEPFLKTYLPSELLTRIDWNSIDFYKMGGRHREQNTKKEFEADVIYLCNLDGKQAMLWVHAEHQSGSDPIMILRVANYQFAELLSFARQNPAKPLPTIVTILYHQGKKPWKATLKLEDLFAEPALAMRYLMRPILVDLPSRSDQELTAHENIGPAELIMKYIRRKDFAKKLSLFARIIHTVDDKSRSTVLEYIINAVHITEAELTEVAQHCMQIEDKEKLMTLADRLVARGMQQGVQQGMQQGIQQGVQQERLAIAKSMLLKGFEHDLIAETTALTLQEIKALQKGLSH